MKTDYLAFLPQTKRPGNAYRCKHGTWTTRGYHSKKAYACRLQRDDEGEGIFLRRCDCWNSGHVCKHYERQNPPRYGPFAGDWNH